MTINFKLLQEDKFMNVVLKRNNLNVSDLSIERQMDRFIDRKIGRQIDIDRQIDRWIDKQNKHD